MNNIVKGFYIHTRTNIRYKVLGVAKMTCDPKTEYVVYEQVSPKYIRGETKYEDGGNIWIHKKEDFFSNRVDNQLVKKFVKTTDNNSKLSPTLIDPDNIFVI